MTKEYLQAMKADLVEVYKEDLCKESLAAIEKAQTLQEFINIVHEFSTYLRYKNIPKIDWVRKWFKGHIDEAMECGAYVDVIASVKNPTDKRIIIYGDSKVTGIFSDPHAYSVTCQDDSELKLLTIGVTAVKIRLKDNSRVSTIYQDNDSQVRIRKI